MRNKTKITKKILQARDFIYSKDWEALYKLYVPEVGGLWKLRDSTQPLVVFADRSPEERQVVFGPAKSLAPNSLVMLVSVTSKENFFKTAEKTYAYMKQKESWEPNKVNAQIDWWMDIRLLLSWDFEIIWRERVWTSYVDLDEWDEAFTLAKTEV